MFFIFGTKFVIEDIAAPTEKQKEYCPRCKKETFFSRINGRRYFHIFFLPLFPTSGRVTGIKCDICKNIREVPHGWSPGSEKAERERVQKLVEEFKGKDDKEKEELLGKWFDETMEKTMGDLFHKNLFHEGPLKLDEKTYKFVQKRQRRLFGTSVKRELYVFNNATNEWELGDQNITERVIKEGIPI